MNIANFVVGLVLNLHTVFFIVALVAGIWTNFRINAGRLGTKTRALAWASFASCLLMAVSYLGQVILVVRSGSATGGSVLVMLFMTVLWGFFSAQSYSTLRKIGAI